MRNRVLLAALVAAIGVAGCGDDPKPGSQSSGAKPVGRESAGSVVQFADCGDWRKGSPAERYATVREIRGQLTPQLSKSAASPLPDERAYAMLQRTCSAGTLDSLRLYKLYVRMQGFAPLAE